MPYLRISDDGSVDAVDEETNRVVARGRLVIPFIPQGTDSQIIGDVQFVTDPISGADSASQADAMRVIGGLNS